MSVNLDQQRAARAWQQATEGVAGKGKVYVVLAKGAPALIISNGLMQTLAFYQAKAGKDGNKPHGMLLKHICQWLGEQLGGASLNDGAAFPKADADFQSIMNALFRSDSDLYRRATRETLALLKWIRQFAGAIGEETGQ